jgi:hypothetical protein
MLKLSLGLFMVGLLAFSAGGCGGGTLSGNDAATGLDAQIMADGAVPLDAAHPGDFVSADVDGVTMRGEFGPAAGTMGLADGQIWINAGFTSKTTGWLLYIQNSVGTTTCSPSWIALFGSSGGTLRSDSPGGSCSVTVTAPAPALGDVVEGTFTATLGRAVTPASTAAVTNGVFRVTRGFQ